MAKQRKEKRKKKNHGCLKLTATLLILLAAGGTVFYRGYISLEIPEGRTAVIFTKTGGWDSRVYHPGEFQWRWERIFPTNMTIHLFPSHARVLQFSHQGTLPSGKTYAKAVSEVQDFSYSYQVSMVYRLRDQELPRLLSEGEIDPENPGLFYRRYDQLIQAEFTPQEGLTAQDREEYQAKIREELENSFPELHIESVTFLSLQVPDLELYRRAKEIYLKGMNVRENRLFQAETRQILEDQQREHQLELLRQYGEVFSEYPVLLEYFEMDPDSPLKPQDLVPEGAAVP